MSFIFGLPIQKFSPKKIKSLGKKIAFFKKKNVAKSFLSYTLLADEKGIFITKFSTIIQRTAL